MLEVKNLNFAYSQEDAPIIKNISFCIHPGMHVGIVGACASGKSTLLKAILDVEQDRTGVVTIDSIDINHQNRFNQVSLIGYVPQDPSHSLIRMRLFDELSYTAQALGWCSSKIKKSVANIVSVLSLDKLQEIELSNLSGGQQQLVSLASALVHRPIVLLLDEATSHLSEKYRELLRITLLNHKKAGGIVVQVTHDWREILQMDEIIILDNKTIVWRGNALDFLISDELCKVAEVSISKSVRSLIRILKDNTIGLQCIQAYALEELVGLALDSSSELVLDNLGMFEKDGEKEGYSTKSEYILKVTNLSYSYSNQTVSALSSQNGIGFQGIQDCSLALKSGQIYLLCGPSGAGKSTLSLLLSGLLKPDGGDFIACNNKSLENSVAYSFQRPESMFYLPTVKMELDIEDGCSQSQRQTLNRLNVTEEILEKNPYELSGGQKRAVALADTCLVQKDIYIFDEPSSGLDGRYVNGFIEQVCAMRQTGKTIVIVTHDIDLWYEVADECIVMTKGTIYDQFRTDELRKGYRVLKDLDLQIPFSCVLQERTQGVGYQGEINECK